MLKIIYLSRNLAKKSTKKAIPTETVQEISGFQGQENTIIFVSGGT